MKRANLAAAAPWITLVAGIAVILVVVQALGYAAKRSDDLRFGQVADDLYARIEQQVEAHFSLLRATHAYVETAAGEVTVREFSSYVSRLRLRGRYVGIQGIGYVKRLEPADTERTERLLQAEYPRGFRIWPQPTGSVAYPVVYLEPDDQRNAAALGFDMESEAAARETIDRASKSSELAVSAPTIPDQGGDGDKQPGFLAFQAVRLPGADGQPRLVGLVYAPFRSDDFFTAAIGAFGTGPVSIEVFDTDANQLLYASGNDNPPTRAFIDKTLAVGGRLWTLRFRPRSEFLRDSSAAYLPYVGLLGLLLAGALAFLSWQQSHAQQTAEREAALLRAAGEDKDVLLKEMRHRIKNVIARVQAIARQTARNSGTLDEFQSSFDARLASMAKTYDLLTASQWSGASLEDVLHAELVSVVGRTDVDYRTSGPSVMLGAREALALGLAFHELTTNALKYGALAQEGGALSVEWETSRSGPVTQLRLVWRERPAQAIEAPKHAGFGSRLIDTAITRELDGHVERDFRPEGLTVTITIGLRPQETG